MDKYITLDECRELFAKRAAEFPYVPAEYRGLVFPPGVGDAFEDLKTFEVRDDDSWIVTYPKAGTTWTQEIMSCVMHDGDLEEVNKRHWIVNEMPSPRLIKSHLPGPLMPPQLWVKKPRIVYVMRNPKDLTVSYFYFMKMINSQQAEQSFGAFFEEMLAGKVIYGPWWDHYLYYWQRRHDPNILLLRFEDMKRDLRGNVEKISRFLGKNLSSETLDAITEHCTFANMKNNPMAIPRFILEQDVKPAGGFMRKGKVGDWKSHFTVAQNEAMDAHIREKLHGTGLTFDY